MAELFKNTTHSDTPLWCIAKPRLHSQHMRIASLNKEMDTLVKMRYANTVAANHVKEDVGEATRSMLNVLIMTDPDQIKKKLANTEARSASATAQVAELAKSTGDAEAAAREIKLLIGDSVDKVQEGGTLVGQAGVTMEEVVESVRRVTDIMGEITAAGLEQSAGIAQVSATIVAMDETTQQNAVLVEEAATAAASMQEQAQRVARAVSVFKLQTTSPHAQAQTPRGLDLAQTQLARPNQAPAAA